MTKITIEQQCFRVYKVGDTIVQLTTQEARMFEAVVRRNGEAVRKYSLLTEMSYDYREEPEVKIVDVIKCKVIKKFRKALNIPQPENKHQTRLGEDVLLTVWGFGYKFNVEKYEFIWDTRTSTVNVPISEAQNEILLDACLVLGKPVDEVINMAIMEGVKSLKSKVY